MDSCKVYVPVRADFDKDGNIMPREITWADGRTFAIDKVLDIRQAAAMKAIGQGDRYTIRVCGKQSGLFFERTTNLSGSRLGKWFAQRL